MQATKAAFDKYVKIIKKENAMKKAEINENVTKEVKISRKLLLKKKTKTR
jgi:hypothetical protein